ncbi:MAG: hypothetical protein V1820_00140 [archaeon]
MAEKSEQLAKAAKGAPAGTPTGTPARFPKELPKSVPSYLPSDPRELYNLLITEKYKRDEANSKVREAISTLKLLRDERDGMNKEIAGLKEQRNSSRARGREMIKQAKVLREMLKGFEAPKGSSTSLGKLIEELDFKYQTNPVPFEEEKRLVKKIEELKKLWKARKFVEKKRANISSISTEVDTFFSESDELHKQVVEKAEKSEGIHKLFIEKIHEIDKLRAKSNEAHQLVVKYAQALGDAREIASEERIQRRAEELLEQEKFLKERAEQVWEKIESKISAQSGKKSFNFRDLQVLSAVSGEDFSLEKATRARKKN